MDSSLYSSATSMSQSTRMDHTLIDVTLKSTHVIDIVRVVLHLSNSGILINVSSVLYGILLVVGVNHVDIHKFFLILLLLLLFWSEFNFLLLVLGIGSKQLIQLFRIVLELDVKSRYRYVRQEFSFLRSCEYPECDTSFKGGTSFVLSCVIRNAFILSCRGRDRFLERKKTSYLFSSLCGSRNVGDITQLFLLFIFLTLSDIYILIMYCS